MTAVLFTCAGQRVDIVTAFKRAGATTIASDLDRLAPALYHADHMALVPRVDDPGYLPALAALVAEHDVKLVVPVTDIDQSIVARGRAQLEPALLLAPPYEVCATMADKYVAHVFFEEHGIESPRTWLPGEVPDDARYPLLVKIREGFGSRHIYRAADADELAFFLRHTPVESMVQELCLGEEFSIDVFCDLEGRCLNAIARTMIQSKGGESIKGTSILDTDADRARPPGRRDDRDRRPGLRPVLPRARRLAARDRRQPALRRRASRCRSRPGAATRSSRSRSRTASGPSRASASTAPGCR